MSRVECSGKSPGKVRACSGSEPLRPRSLPEHPAPNPLRGSGRSGNEAFGHAKAGHFGVPERTNAVRALFGQSPGSRK